MILADFPPWFLRGFAVLFGLIWGSFLNVVVHRLPRGMSLSRPASHCPACNTPIPFYRNIPVLSWLWMRGRAPCCGARVSPRYLVVELIGGMLSLAVLEATVMPLGGSVSFGFAMATYVANFALCLGLVAAAFIDLEHMFIPDRISLGGTVLGIGTFALRDMTLLDAALGAAVGLLVVWLPLVVGYEKLRGRPGMGLGDAKLTMLAGAWLGWGGALLVLGAGAIQGTIAVLVMTLFGVKLEEPEAVKREREELRAELEALRPEERAAIEEELGHDPLAEEPEEGLLGARLAFGPFLILAILEGLLIGRERIFAWIGGL
ncbi:MAG: prepilin peptidase [Myxococcales bacterium]|nr:prepilin peptidase [Myxococcales bacterium]